MPRASYAEQGQRVRDAMAIRAYLELLHQRPAHGSHSKLSDERRARIVSGLTSQIEHERDPIRRLQLISRREQHEQAIGAPTYAAQLAEAQAQAVPVLAAWADRKGISWQALREGGVPAVVLRQAGITP